MSPATPWAELTATAMGWQQGFTIPGGNPNDFFIDVLFEGALFANPHISWTELTAPATTHSELSVPATVWTELT